MSNHCTRLLEAVLLLTGISLSLELPTIQIQKGDEVNLAYSCIHVLDDNRKDLPPVIMLHGIADSRKTWNGIYQVIALITGRRVCTVDVRNHGDSDWNDDFNVDIMADDVMNLMKKLKIEKAVFIGHSMGGLITMSIAHQQPEKVEMMIIEDITPDFSKEIGEGILMFLKVVKQSITMIPADSTETEAQGIIVDSLKKTMGDILSKDIGRMNRHFLDIRQENGVWKLKMNVDVLIKTFENPESFGSKTKRNVYSGKALVIYGTASDLRVFENKDTILQYFPKSEFVGIQGATHTIHPFYPQFLTEVLKFLKRS